MMATMSAKPGREGRRRVDLWGFFVFSHVWTWLFWSIAALWGEDVWTSPAWLLLFLGGLGPFLAGIIMTGLTQGRRGLRELGRRTVDARPVRSGWWATIFLLSPAATLLGAAVYTALGASRPALDLGSALERLAHPGQLLLFAGFVLLFGPVPEEIGWRGYALDRLQERWSALGASLGLGAAWGAWHIPLFFMEGFYGEVTPEPLHFMFNVTVLSVLFTWIYNNTSRSVLAAILFHFMDNLTGELLQPSPEVRLAKTVIIILVVLVVLARWGPTKLTRRAAG
jgi:membrane protease YdiL (CAAX protease family)